MSARLCHFFAFLHLPWLCVYAIRTIDGQVFSFCNFFHSSLFTFSTASLFSLLFHVRCTQTHTLLMCAAVVFIDSTILLCRSYSRRITFYEQCEHIFVAPFIFCLSLETCVIKSFGSGHSQILLQSRSRMEKSTPEEHYLFFILLYAQQDIGIFKHHGSQHTDD